MAGRADIATHLSQRRRAIDAVFADWATKDLSAPERADVVEKYFQQAKIGMTQRVGNGNSIRVSRPSPDSRRPNILIVGRHGTRDLAPGPNPVRNDLGFCGPGLASRLGPTIAFVEGLGAARTVADKEAVNATYLSLGDDDTFSSVVPTIAATGIDAVFLTNAVAWSPDHPTITTGSRGQIVAELRLRSGGSIDDFVTSGAVRNPLTKMMQLLGELRDQRGRIVLPGFYERAKAPNDRVRALLKANNHDPSAWSNGLRLAAPSGRLSSLERAALWPGISVLDIKRDNDSTLSNVAAPGSSEQDPALDQQQRSTPTPITATPANVTATVAIYLVPDQRHAEVESALRKWFTNQVTTDLHPRVKMLSATRPYRTPAKSVALAAQTRAGHRLSGRNPILVPAGGPAGAGEAAFTMGVPVAFAGLVPPSTSYNTTSEVLGWAHFSAGVALAAETALELRRT